MAFRLPRLWLPVLSPGTASVVWRDELACSTLHVAKIPFPRLAALSREPWRLWCVVVSD